MSISDKYDRSEAGIVVRWIQKHCVVPIGADKGNPAQLSAEQRNVVKHELLIHHPALAAYLALAHTCGIQARGSFRPKLNVDAGIVWDAAGPSIFGGAGRHRHRAASKVAERTSVTI
jgi:hypothetical protein